MVNNAMVTTQSKQITLEEFWALPETKPASEYIDGKIIQKTMPKGKHSTIQAELIIALNGVLKTQKIARAFPQLRCTFGDRYTIPDVSVFTCNRITRESNSEIADSFQAAPDWTIEILSPNRSQTKVTDVTQSNEISMVSVPSGQSIFNEFSMVSVFQCVTSEK